MSRPRSASPGANGSTGGSGRGSGSGNLSGSLVAPADAGAAAATGPASSAEPAPAPDWHWPRFGPVLCGTMTDRERLGLPERFVPGRLAEALALATAELRTASDDQLLALLYGPQATLAQRIAAGQLLALAGDPRIRVLRPAMVAVPGGTVAIGLDPAAVDGVLARFAGLGLDRRWIEKECPRHALTLVAFRLGRYPVTNAEYRAFLLDTGHAELPSSWALRQYPAERANHPVYTVSAAAADAYAAWLARRTGRGFRLPTEAEWEWAAAGPQGRVFPWGDAFDADRANTAETGLFCSSPVGVFSGGDAACGASDLAGNVEEYVADRYAAYPGGRWVDDHLSQLHGTPDGYRVARGGSFARFRDLARTQRRHGHNPRSATYAMGFRLAETV